jgi:hypothetical protein
MSRYVWHVVAIAVALGGVSASRAAAQPPTMPYKGSPNAMMLPLKMSCQIQIRDSNGKVLPDPILSAIGLKEAFVFYQVSNDSKLPANDFDLTGGVSAVGSCTPDCQPANKELLKTLYTQAFSLPKMTLAPGKKSLWAQAGKIALVPVNTTWTKEMGPTTPHVALTVQVRINPGGVNKSCSQPVHVEYAQIP